jgi:glycosyltransferase involved in cell wall biosynthesis
MPIVSVIIPAFNAKDTLNETLKSVISQTRLDWEAIIVNDGSTDETLTLAQAWCRRDPRIRLISRPNKGLAATRNDGAAMASGPWLLFLDADDLIEPKWMNAMLGVAAAKPDACVLHCGYVKFLPDGRWDDPVVPPDDDYFENLSRQNLFQPNALLVRRELFVELGGFDPAFSACADWDMWLRIARTGARFAGIDEALARYRLSQNQMSRGAEALFWDSCRVIDVAHGRDPRV